MMQKKPITNREQKQPGFTLMEILITIAVSGIILSVGMVQYIQFNRTQTLKAAAQTLKNNLRDTQAKAATGLKPTQCNSGSTLNGYIVSYVDATRYQTIADCTGTPPATTYTLPPDTKFTGAFTQFRFNALGAGVSANRSLNLQHIITNACYQISVTTSGNIVDQGVVPCI